MTTRRPHITSIPTRAARIVGWRIGPRVYGGVSCQSFLQILHPMILDAGVDPRVRVIWWFIHTLEHYAFALEDGEFREALYQFRIRNMPFEPGVCDRIARCARGLTHGRSAWQTACLCRYTCARSRGVARSFIPPAIVRWPDDSCAATLRWQRPWGEHDWERPAHNVQYQRCEHGATANEVRGRRGALTLI